MREKEASLGILMAVGRRPAMSALLWLAVLLCASSTVRAVGVAKSVHVSVRAKWECTSLLLEAGLDFDQPSVCISGGM